MIRTTLAIALAASVMGLVMSQPAAAVTQSRFQVQTGANACTLSVPTTDTKIRPRATGFRNEGTTNAFVICTFNPPGGATSLDTNLSYVNFILKSMDGADHEVTCTGVNSIANLVDLGGTPQQFISKTVTVNDTGPYGTLGTNILWEPADFGAVDSIPSSGGAFSVTCILPPQVSVSFMSAPSEEDVGN